MATLLKTMKQYSKYITWRKKMLSFVIYLLPSTMVLSLYKYKYLMIRQQPVMYNRSVYYSSLLDSVPSNTIYFRHIVNASYQTVQSMNIYDSAGAKTIHIETMLPWENRTLLNTTNKTHHYARFKPVMTAAEYNDTMALLHTFQSVCQSHNLTFILYGGSMLGAYRHFGMIPWDDDIDVLMNITEKDKIGAILSQVPGYKVVIKHNFQWKFHRDNSNNTCCEIENQQPSVFCNNWPFIDIFFFQENLTHIWDNTSTFDPKYCYKKKDMLPLTMSPFESFLMPVPRNLRNVLDVSYNVELCSSLHFSHKCGYRTKRANTVPCKRLYQLFPFVFETMLEERTIIRSLMIGEQLIYETFYG